MNLRKIIIGGVLATTVVGTLVFAPVVEAYRGDMTKTGPNHTETREQAMESVMEKQDFAGWQKLMTENGNKPGVMNKVDTQAEYNKFTEAWKLAQAGKTAEANKIRAELGLGTGNGGQGKGQGQGANRGQNNGGNFVDANKDGKCDNLN